MTNSSEGEATWVEGEFEAIEVPMSSISRNEKDVVQVKVLSINGPKTA